MSTRPTTLADLTAAELTAGYRAGDFSPVEATEAALERVEERDGALNAFVLVDAEAALASARESAQRYQDGTPRGPGDGVPTSMKDVFLTKGWPTLRGSRLIPEDGPWEVDAPAVARLREAGAVLFGKTTTPEFAWKGTTDSPRYGATGSPYDPSTHAGGSSGGAAAAVGAGMGPWTVGTDAGGSVRIPAAFTGTFALKPTAGLVPMYPTPPYGTLAHAGPMTRTVTDAALLMDIITGYDPRDWCALPTPQTSFVERLGDGVAGLRIAFSRNLGYGTNEPEVERLVEQAVQVLAQAGAEVEEVDPPITDPIEDFHVLWFTAAAKVLEPYGQEALDIVDPALRRGIEEHRGDTVMQELAATALRQAMGAAMGEFHQNYDLLLTPTMPITSFTTERQSPEGWHSDLWTSWTPYTYPFNMTQQPAASVPCGLTEAGLPVGLQIVGRRHDDARVLRAARAYEVASGEQFTRPPQLG